MFLIRSQMVQGTSELDGVVSHRVRQSPFGELCWVRQCHGGTVNDEPVAHRPEVGPHLGQPFPVVCPIKDGDIGGDGRVCLVGRHYEKIKYSQLLVLLQSREIAVIMNKCTLYENLIQVQPN